YGGEGGAGSYRQHLRPEGRRRRYSDLGEQDPPRAALSVRRRRPDPAIPPVLRAVLRRRSGRRPVERRRRIGAARPGAAKNFEQNERERRSLMSRLRYVEGPSDNRGAGMLRNTVYGIRATYETDREVIDALLPRPLEALERPEIW